MDESSNRPALRSSVAAGIGCLVVQAWTAATIPEPAFSKYTQAATLWTRGELDAERLVDFSPAYFRLVGLVLDSAGDPTRWLVALQIVLVAAAVAGLHALMAQRFSTGLAWLGSVVLILDRHLLVYGRVLEPEILLLACLVGVAVLLDGVPEPWHASGPWCDALAGLVAGLAIATRPTFLPVFLLVPVLHGLRGLPKRRLLARTLPFYVGLLPGLLLVLSTAEQATGDLRTPVMNPGTVFFEGQHPLSRGTSAVYPPAVTAMLLDIRDEPDVAHDLYRRVARSNADCTGSTALRVREVNGFWSDRARHHVLADPGVTLERAATKLRYAFHTFRWHDLPAAWVLDSRLPLPSVPLAFVSALAILGMVAELRRWRDALVFYTLAMVPLAVMVAFYVSARQRLVWVPALIYFALVGVETLRGRNESPVRPAVGALLVIALIPLFVWPDDAIRDEIDQRRTATALDQALGTLRADSEPWTRKGPELVRAFAASPAWFDGLRPAWIPQDETTLDEQIADWLEADETSSSTPSRRFDIAALLLDTGRLDAADRLLEPLVADGFRAYREGRAPSDPRILLARSSALQDDRAAAIELLESVLADHPGEPFALAELAAVVERSDPRRQDVFNELALGYSQADLDWIVGRAARAHGQAADALVHFERLSRCLPEWRGAHLHHALALADLGRHDEAIDALVTANRLGIEPLVDTAAVQALVRAWSRRHADDLDRQWLAARLLYQHGAFADALSRIDAARGLAPPPELAQRLDRLAEQIRTLGDPGPI